MITAETAVVLPAIVLVLAMTLGVVRVAVDQIRCVDAARAGARAAARGDPDARVRAVATQAAPAGSSITVDGVNDDVVVVVTGPRVMPVPLVDGLPAPSGRAVAAVEGPTGTGPDLPAGASGAASGTDGESTTSAVSRPVGTNGSARRTRTGP